MRNTAAAMMLAMASLNGAYAGYPPRTIKRRPTEYKDLPFPDVKGDMVSTFARKQRQRKMARKGR